jgi:GT2 family glycosyltransferase
MASDLKLIERSRSLTRNVLLRHRLQQVQMHLEGGRPDEALRQIDRAMRCMPDDWALIAPIYGQILAGRGDFESALRLFLRAQEISPGPGSEAAIIGTLLSLGRTWAAAQRLEFALWRYAVDPDGALQVCAQRTLGSGAAPGADGTYCGWVGVTPTLELIGAAIPARPDALLQVGAAGSGAPLASHPLRGPAGQPVEFRLPLPVVSPIQSLQVELDGAPLLGSGLVYPPDFDLDGRASSRDGLIVGWARLGWAPWLALELIIEDETGARQRLGTHKGGPGASPGGFRLDLEKAGIRGTRIDVSVVLPDGRRALLPDAPLLLERAVPPANTPLDPRWATPRGASATVPTAGVARRPRPVDVIVPVFSGRDQTLACLDSVLRTLPRWAQLVVIDDASPDTELSAALDAMAASGKMALHRNRSNLGFPAAVNRGMALHRGRDCVLLNADTVVFGNWLERLQSAAYSDAKAGTVTPFTNQGAIASYPLLPDYQCSEAEAAMLDEFAAREHQGMTAEIPVGVGFCLYVRRDCLNQIGVLDYATFGKGYGEESDFCMRARARGWRHLLAADVFVLHAGGVSFGRRRTALLERSNRLLNLRHPGYDALVRKFAAADPLAPFRRRFDEHKLVGMAGRCVLMVKHGLPGGVDRFLADQRQRLRQRGLAPLFLVPPESGGRGCVIRTDNPAIKDLRYRTPQELGELQSLLGRLQIEHIEIHHFMGLDGRLIELLRKLGVPYDVYVHDYVWICPRVTLIDGSNRYCGEPAVSRCETCVKRNGSMLKEKIGVADLRVRSARWLESARSVIVPATDVARRLERYFPTVHIRVEPWEAVAEPVPLPARPPVQVPIGASRPVRVAVIGAIGWHKGYRVLLACARNAAALHLPLEFVVLGSTHDDAALVDTGKVFVTGVYGEAEIIPLIQRERPDLALFPSVWPETWCYTLTHALVAGLLVTAFDLGAIAERLRAAGTGVIVPLDTKPDALNRRLLRIGRDVRRRLRAAAAGNVPAGIGNGDVPAEKDSRSATGITEPFAAIGYTIAMKSNMPSVADAAKASKDSLNSTSQVMRLPRGLYFFSVSTATPPPSSAAAGIPLPAVHVCCGPGVAPGQVEITTGPDAQGTWLYQSGTMLVVKVAVDQAPMVLTSISVAGAVPLNINIERLDGRQAAPLDPAALAANLLAGNPGAGAGLPPAPPSLRLQVSAHVRSRGDMNFVDAAWAGRVASGLWIESFAVTPLEKITAQDIEYKGLTASGFESPWLSNGAPCGTRGLGVPLVGFSIRLKQGAGTEPYDCEYSGYFRSGITAGPYRNGTPCRSTVPNDPLEGIQIRVVERQAADASAIAPPEAAAGSGTGKPETVGPRFSKFRDDEPVAASAKPAPQAGRSKPVPAPSAAATKLEPKSKPAVAKAGKPASAPASPAPSAKRRSPGESK